MIKIHRSLIVGLFIVLNSSIFAQGIGFYDVSFETAIEIAQRKNKNIFIDTYAEWCVPCKSFERELRIPEVASFFNNNYINVKIDLDHSEHAQAYKEKYGIVFLPTIILLSPEGEVKYTVDKFISGLELKAIADAVTDPDFFIEDESTVVDNNPFGSASVVSKGEQLNETYEPELTAEIKSTTYYSGQSGANPLYLKKEAYFRMGLGDGSHKDAVAKYLDTQKDWKSPDNVRFIFDFLENFESIGFDFLIKNSGVFTEIITETRLNTTLQMILFNDKDLLSDQQIHGIFKILSPLDADAKAESFIADGKL